MLRLKNIYLPSKMAKKSPFSDSDYSYSCTKIMTTCFFRKKRQIFRPDWVKIAQTLAPE
jgi:hypothetical protein